MSRSLIALFTAVVAFNAFAGAAGTHLPITSKAELDHYLRQTPPGSSPLDALSPGARKRFLAGITFYPHAVGLQFSEPAAELTHAQTVALYGLFGEQKQAEELSLGLTPEEKFRRDAERQADARARGCIEQACPESEVERRFDELNNADNPSIEMTSAQRIAADMRNYDRLFGTYQTPQRLRELSAPDLRLVTRATNFALYSPDNRHVAELALDLAEMHRRGMTTDDDYATLYRLALSGRQFAKAQAIAHAHPGMKVDAIPALRQHLSLRHHWPTALSIDPLHPHAMLRKSYDPDLPLLIVAVTDEGCHYCEEAATAIQGNASLRRLFAHHAIWLASQDNDFQYVMSWNHRFPSQPMLVAWQNSEWPKLDWSALPAFYVFRNGRVVKKVLGWDGVQKFTKALQETQALR